MPHTRVQSIDHTVRTTNRWLAVLADMIGTEDRDFAQRVLKTWPHTVRDSLTADSAAHFAAQLPDLLRGVYYSGWDPSHAPIRREREKFIEHFARSGRIALSDVPKLASTVTQFLCRELSEPAVTHVLNRLPQDVQALLRPAGPDRKDR